MDLRPVDTKGYPVPPAPSTFGRPARLDWIAIRDLVIDPGYQREIGAAGRKNVVKIAAAFNWSMFAPVIVSPAGGDRYAIVDGQHRTTAAALVGIEKVPCCVIEAKRGEQAAAFKAINANVTRMHTTSLLHAAIAAGEKSAVRMKAVADAANVRMLRSPVPASLMKVGDTIAISSIGKIIERFGDAISIMTLALIRDAGGGIPGSLKQQAIVGVAEVLADHPEWVKRPVDLKHAFSDLDIVSMLMEAFEQSAKRKGVSALMMFEAALLDALRETFREVA